MTASQNFDWTDNTLLAGYYAHQFQEDFQLPAESRFDKRPTALRPAGEYALYGWKSEYLRI